jgi:hypothetical protein
MREIIPEYMWQHVGVDILGPYTLRSGEQKMALIAVDYLGKGVVLESMRDMTAESVIEVLVEKVFEKKGVPEAITGDRCKQFLGKVAEKVFEGDSVEYLPSTAYHQQGNGQVERQVQTAIPLVKAGLDAGKSWRETLRQVGMNMNNMLVSNSTGVSPYEMEMGRPYRTGLDNKVKKKLEELRRIRKAQRDTVKGRKAEMTVRYNEGKKLREFESGDMVMVKNRNKKRKMEDDRIGPFMVQCRLNKTNYLVFDHRRWSWSEYNIEDMYWPEKERKVYDFRDYHSRSRMGQGNEIVGYRMEREEVPVVDRLPVAKQGGDGVIEPVVEQRPVEEVRVEDRLRSPEKSLRKEVSLAGPKVGDRVEVYWPDARWKDEWLKGTVVAEAKGGQRKNGSHLVEFDMDVEKGVPKV